VAPPPVDECAVVVVDAAPGVAVVRVLVGTAALVALTNVEEEVLVSG